MSSQHLKEDSPVRIDLLRIERHPAYQFILVNVAAVVFWVVLAPHRLPPGRIRLLGLLVLLVTLDSSWLIGTYMAKRKKKGP